MWDMPGSPRDGATILRTLRANLIPCPRVIVPGLKTTFPIWYCPPDGRRSIVGSLEECFGLLQTVPDSAVSLEGNLPPEESDAYPADQGFFQQFLPVESTVVLEARDLRGPDVGNQDRQIRWELSSRAGYCLGMDEASVLIGLGPGGPWVLDVTPISVSREGSGDLLATTEPRQFLGAVGEYVRNDFLGQDSLVSLCKVFIPPGWMGSGRLMDEGCLSSPMPYLDMPLSTRFRFSGLPDRGFLRLLDRSLGLLGMLISPPEEARERHLTEEGVLGSIFRPEPWAPDCVFEYMSVPSLLWDPVALEGLTVVARLVASHFLHLAEKIGPGRLTPLNLKGNYQWQKAYYGASRRFFQDDLSHLKGAMLPLAATPGDIELLEYVFSRASTLGWAPPLGLGQRDPQSGRVDPTSEPAPAPAFAPIFVPASVPTIVQAPALNPTLQHALPLGRSLPAESLPLGTGPAVGIMVGEPRQSARIRHGRFGVETDRFKLLCQMGRSMGLTVYVFSADDFGTGTSTSGDHLDAWIYAERRGWVRTEVPLPDVVYDRCIPQIREDGFAWDAAEAFHRVHPEVKFVNSMGFTHCCRDKLTFHRVLSQDAECASHLPRTEALLCIAQAVRFAAEHRVTFIKDRYGTGSKGLVRMERGLCRPEPIIDCLLRANPGREYILQEGLPLVPSLPDTPLAVAPSPSASSLRNLGSTFEVRVIYQKGGLGRWRRTGMVCRVNPGRESYMVPGQEVHRRVDHVLAPLFPGRLMAVKDRIRALARRIPYLLEDAWGVGGEMSIDIGLDRDGKPWLIEVNSKPASLFRDIGAFAYRRLSLQRVLNYCVYLGRGGRTKAP